MLLSIHCAPPPSIPRASPSGLVVHSAKRSVLFPRAIGGALQSDLVAMLSDLAIPSSDMADTHVPPSVTVGLQRVRGHHRESPRATEDPRASPRATESPRGSPKVPAGSRGFPRIPEDTQWSPRVPEDTLGSPSAPECQGPRVSPRVPEGPRVSLRIPECPRESPRTPTSSPRVSADTRGSPSVPECQGQPPNRATGGQEQADSWLLFNSLVIH